MKERTIEKQLDFRASPERVWSAIVEWSLAPREGGGTTLRLRETGFLTDLHHQQNTGGWDEELGGLVQLLGSS